MIGVNPRILVKINELLGKGAPDELREFFEKILELETKTETKSFTTTEISQNYKALITKYAKESKIIKFLEAID